MRSVTVIMPARNAAATIRRALDSVLAQRSPAPAAVVVVDDGSTDGTASVVRATYGDRVCVLRREPRGRAAARNAALAIAETDLVAFLDADDLWLGGHLRALVAPLLSDSRVALAYGRHVVRSAARERESRTPPLSGRLRGADLLRFRPWTGAVVVRRDALLEIGGFDESLETGEDVKAWLSLALRWPVRFVDAVVAVYNRRALPASHQVARMKDMLRVLEWLRRAAGRRSGIPRWAFKARRAVHMLRAARRLAFERGVAAALDLWRRAAREAPWWPEVWIARFAFARARAIITRHGLESV